MSKSKVTFELKAFYDSQDRLTKGIFVDGKHFDWGINEDDFKEAELRAKKLSEQVNPSAGFAYMQTVKDSIQRHFVDSLSEFLGRQITVEEVNQATKTGLI